MFLFIIFKSRIIFFYIGCDSARISCPLRRQTPQLKWEGLSKIKIALTGTDTSSLTRLLEGCFGSVEPNPPSLPVSINVAEPSEEHPAEEVSRSDTSSPVTESSLATAELCFPYEIYSPSSC